MVDERLSCCKDAAVSAPMDEFAIEMGALSGDEPEVEDMAVHIDNLLSAVGEPDLSSDTASASGPLDSNLQPAHLTPSSQHAQHILLSTVPIWTGLSVR